MSKSLKFLNVLTCEHVISGPMIKPTLVGVYSGDILIQSLPGTITMGIYAEHLPDITQHGKLTLKLMLGKQMIGKVVAETDGNDPLGIIAVPFVPLTITENTRFRVIASCDGFKDKTIVDQKITEGVLPASPSPIA